ncbi:MAG TPA: aminotransferase class I/II-fold pyridoxal phosphate-dependent enzyme [Polyangia bacterium]|jgi:alanine-synthesizing transaminase|nr:aminotransferase class I/II-fold pyridoxal phosphate-dependent enzyme [Polyangia bacterium]
MAGQFDEFARLASLPPYVLAAVDELKSRLRAEGHDVFDFGLGNPDGPSPVAVIERLTTEVRRPGNQRYMPSKGLPEVRRAICDWYQRRYQQTFDPDKESVVTIGAKEGLAHLLLALVGPGDCVLSPDPCYPIHRYGVIIAGGEPVPVAVRPGGDHFAAIEAALGKAPRKPKGLIVNFPHNPTSATADLGFYARVVALARREHLWVISDLAYADLSYDGQSAPSIFQVPGARDVAVEFFTVSKSYSMPGWRVGFCVGGERLVGALTTIKGYLDYGIFAPAQLAAATALSSCDADVVANRDRYRHRAEVLVRGLGDAGWSVDKPIASMFVWAAVPASHRHLGAVGFASALLERAKVAVSPGLGFGPGGEGYVRFALIEPDQRVAKACAAIGKFLREPV